MVKKLFVNIDEAKSGVIKTDVFSRICALHNIRLDPTALSKLAQDCKPTTANTGDSIMYKEAL